MSTGLEIFASLAVIAGLLILTLAVAGLLRLPNDWLRLHSAGQAAAPGLLAILLGAAGVGEVTFIARSVLLAVVALVTTPVAAHAIALRIRELEQDSTE